MSKRLDLLVSHMQHVKSIANNYNYFKIDLVYPTSHLNGFEYLFEATGLSGDEYVPILKTVCYSLLSTLISTQKLFQVK